MKPPITIIIPAYNAAPWIGDTLRSVLRQTYTHYTCIVIDDGSTDNTQEIFSSVCAQDARFQYVRQQNAGECAARNAGIELAETDYITFLDSDDIWHPDFLQLMWAQLQQDDVHFAACHYDMFYDGTHIRKPQAWHQWLKSGNLWWDTLSHGEFAMGCWVARTEDVKQVGPFNADLKVAGDRDFILRLLAHIHQGKFAAKAVLLPHTLLAYRQRQGSAVRNVSFALTHEWDMMQEHINHPDIPPKIKRHARSFLAFKMAVIAAFGARDYGLAAKWYAKAWLLCPWNLNLYWLPIRKALCNLGKNEEISWLRHYSQPE